MPNYKYIKSKAENDTQAQQQAKIENQQCFSDLYAEQKSKMIDYLIGIIRHHIEREVTKFYKKGHSDKIRTKGLMNRQYIYGETLLDISAWVLIDEKWENNSSLILIPEDGYPELLFSDIDCLKLFIEEINCILRKDEIKVEVKQNNVFSGKYYILVSANLGKL